MAWPRDGRACEGVCEGGREGVCEGVREGGCEGARLRVGERSVREVAVESDLRGVAAEHLEIALEELPSGW